MSVPVFIHILSNGDVWFGNDANFSPTGTVVATFRANSDSKSQKIGTVSGTTGSYTCSGSTGKFGTEKV